MPIDITLADRGMMRAVLSNLREVDAIEMMAFDTDREKLPELLMRHKVFAFCAYDLVTGPIAVWGMVKRRNGVGAGFAFGTDEWGAALLPMVRHIRGFVLPYLARSGFHRVEALALACRDDVARFMELIGAEPEGLLRHCGTEREDFISYRWLADEYRRTTTARSQEDRPHASH
jgi:hypothetical protein